MARYLISRALMAAFVLLAFRASLWAAGMHSSLLPIFVWAVMTLLSWSLCPESYEVNE